MTAPLYRHGFRKRCANAPYWLICIVLVLIAFIRTARGAGDLWSLALQRTNDHRFSVYFESTDAPGYESNRLDQAIQWCHTNGVTKVYLESFRKDEQLSKETLARARDRFRSR